jgi:hypothetical protein
LFLNLFKPHILINCQYQQGKAAASVLGEKGFLNEEAVFIALMDIVSNGLSSAGLQSEACAAWVLVLAYSHDKYLQEICTFLDEHITSIRHLMTAKDEYGRSAVDVATPKYKTAICSRTYFMKWYEMKEGLLEYKSGIIITCLIITIIYTIMRLSTRLLVSVI